MLRAHLRESGVDEDRIEVMPDERKAVEIALSKAREGDLVVIFGDNISRCWKQVAGFKSDEDAAPDKTVGKLAVSFVESDPDAFSLDAEAELIRDERGVRIARMDEESD